MDSMISDEQLSDSLSTAISHDSGATGTGYSSYEIVQSQLRDLVLFQQATCDRIIEESIVQSNCVIQKTISKEELEKVLKELEEERLAHARTKAKLLEVEDKLEFSLGEIEILQGQLGREKAQFEKAFDILKEKAQKETRERTELVSQCSSLTRNAHKQQSTLSMKEQQLKEMDHKLKLQREQYEKKVVELNLEKQQELYANKLIKEIENTKPKRNILKSKN